MGAEGGIIRVKHYADAYEGSGLSPEEIWEECICDSLGDMNIFAMDPDVNPFMSSMMSEVKAAATSTANEGSQNQTRGSPEGEAKGRASRETDAESAPEYSEEQYDGGNKFAVGTTNRVKAIGTNYKLVIRSYSLQEIADIYKRGNLGSEYDVLFNRLFDYCRNAGITFSVVPEILNAEGKRIAGRSKGKRIVFSQVHFNGSKMSNQTKSEVILHEMLHAATTYAIVAYDIAIKEGATAELPKNILNIGKDIYKVYASIGKNPRFAGDYGIKNPKEMVAKLTDPLFAEKLKGTYPSVWHKLLETICEIFGINKTFTNYDKLTKAVDKLLTHPDYALAKDYYSVLDQNPYYLEDSQYEDASLSKGKASRELDFIDYINEQADEEELARAHSRADESMMNRLHLINALESITEYPSERGILNDYRAMAETIAGSEKRIADIDADIKALSKNAEANAQVIKMLKAEKTLRLPTKTFFDVAVANPRNI